MLFLCFWCIGRRLAYRRVSKYWRRLSSHRPDAVPLRNWLLTSSIELIAIGPSFCEVDVHSRLMRYACFKVTITCKVSKWRRRLQVLWKGRRRGRSREPRAAMAPALPDFARNGAGMNFAGKISLLIINHCMVHTSFNHSRKLHNVTKLPTIQEHVECIIV